MDFRRIFRIYWKYNGIYIELNNEVFNLNFKIFKELNSVIINDVKFDYKNIFAISSIIGSLNNKFVWASYKKWQSWCQR